MLHHFDLEKLHVAAFGNCDRPDYVLTSLLPIVKEREQLADFRRDIAADLGISTTSELRWEQKDSLSVSYPNESRFEGGERIITVLVVVSEVFLDVMIFTSYREISLPHWKSN